MIVSNVEVLLKVNSMITLLFRRSFKALKLCVHLILPNNHRLLREHKKIEMSIVCWFDVKVR